METKHYFSKENIFLDINLLNREEAFKFVANDLLNRGFVREDYFKGLRVRESEFATGLHFGEYGIAIPHTDPEYIIKDFIVILRPQNPIEFKLMIDHDETGEMNLLFFIGVVNGVDSPNVLMHLTSIMQNKKFISEILSCEDKEEMHSKIINYEG